MINCRDCKGYKKCIGKEYYTYTDIRYCGHQVHWVLKNLLLFLDGRWPPTPRIIEPELNIKQRTYSTEAGFIKCRIILADIFSRLDQTGKDGDSLVEAILDEKSDAEFDDDQRSAFHFITGWFPKKSVYRLWKSQRNYRRRLAESIPNFNHSQVCQPGMYGGRA